MNQAKILYACWFEEDTKGLTAILCAPQVYFSSSQSQVKIRDTVSFTHQWPEGLMGSYVELFQTRFNFELFNAWKRNNDKTPTKARIIFLHHLNFPSTQGADCDVTSFNYENKCPIFIFPAPSSLQEPAGLRTSSCQPFQEVRQHPLPSCGEMTQHLWCSLQHNDTNDSLQPPHCLPSLFPSIISITPPPVLLQLYKLLWCDFYVRKTQQKVCTEQMWLVV